MWSAYWFQSSRGWWAILDDWKCITRLVIIEYLMRSFWFLFRNLRFSIRFGGSFKRSRQLICMRKLNKLAKCLHIVGSRGKTVYMMTPLASDGGSSCLLFSWWAYHGVMIWQRSVVSPTAYVCSAIHCSSVCAYIARCYLMNFECFARIYYCLQELQVCHFLALPGWMPIYLQRPPA